MTEAAQKEGAFASSQEHLPHLSGYVMNRTYPGRLRLNIGVSTVIDPRIHGSRNADGARFRCGGKFDSCAAPSSGIRKPANEMASSASSLGSPKAGRPDLDSAFNSN